MHLIHRGIVNNFFKENLLISFKQSFKKGYGVETDIHATKDNCLLNSIKLFISFLLSSLKIYAKVI